MPDALKAAVDAGRPATITVDHPSAGPLDLVGSPIWGVTDPAMAIPPPLLGQHTAQVLRELGRDDDEIAALHERGVVSVARPATTPADGTPPPAT